MRPAAERRVRRRQCFALITLALSVSLAAAAVAAARLPRSELLGLRLGMNDLEVRRRLERIGRLSELQPDAGGRKQIWTLRDSRYATLNLRLTANHDLQWCTAYARPRRIRYSQIGDTTAARRAGRHIWIWAVPASAAGVAYQVTARGTDPLYCSSVALSQPTARPAENEPASPVADSAR